MEILTIGGLFALGTAAFYGFWITAFFALVLLSVLAEHRFWGWATTLAVVTLIGLQQAHVFDIVAYVKNDPWAIVLGVAKYLVGSAVWASFKFWRMCKKVDGLHTVEKAYFLARRDATEMTQDLRVEWSEIVRSTPRLRIPEYTDHKEQILVWMYLWPFSFLGTMFSDWVTKIFVQLYEMMGGTFDAIAKATLKNAQQDIVPLKTKR